MCLCISSSWESDYRVGFSYFGIFCLTQPHSIERVLPASVSPRYRRSHYAGTSIISSAVYRSSLSLARIFSAEPSRARTSRRYSEFPRRVDYRILMSASGRGVYRLCRPQRGCPSFSQIKQEPIYITCRSLTSRRWSHHTERRYRNYTSCLCPTTQC